MTKYFPIGRLAVFLLFLIVTAGPTAGQAPIKPDTPSPAGPTKPSGQDPSRTAPGQGTSKRPGTTVPGPGKGSLKRWGLSLHSGISIPHGNFNTLFDPGPNFGIDLEYRVTHTFSLEGLYGFHRFNGATTGIRNLNAHQFSFNGKVYGSSSPVRPFFNFGGGAYHFNSSSTHGGLNVGAGVQFDVTPTIAVEGVYNFHNVFTSGSSTRFSALQGGIRFRF
jgi:hypothetical protein